jgi:PhnB protein
MMKEKKEDRTMAAVKPIPDGYHTVTPALAVRGAAEALGFYTRAFGAEEMFRMPGPDGSVAHAEIRIGDSPIMLGEECPERGASAPPTIGGSAVSLHLYVKDVDAAFARATGAGCKVEMPPTNMFWGDRYCKLVDPYGHKWSLGTHVEDVSPGEMQRRMAAM